MCVSLHFLCKALPTTTFPKYSLPTCKLTLDSASASPAWNYRPPLGQSYTSDAVQSDLMSGVCAKVLKKKKSGRVKMTLENPLN